MADVIAYKVPDAVRASGIARTALYELMDSGTLPYVRLGGRRQILAADLRALLERNRVVKPAPAAESEPAQSVRRRRRGAES